MRRIIRAADLRASRLPARGGGLVTLSVQRLSSPAIRSSGREAIDEYEANGWATENDSAYGFFFCNGDGERREIRIQPTDPSERVPLDNTSARVGCTKWPRSRRSVKRKALMRALSVALPMFVRI
jgi:hypothetical protein